MIFYFLSDVFDLHRDTGKNKLITLWVMWSAVTDHRISDGLRSCTGSDCFSTHLIELSM